MKVRIVIELDDAIFTMEDEDAVRSTLDLETIKTACLLGSCTRQLLAALCARTPEHAKMIMRMFAEKNNL